jgi:rhodanese-related sulfurtransferase
MQPPPAPKARTLQRRAGKQPGGVGDRIVIDVRTPEEFDAGHVNDARLIDIQGPDFDAQIAELDPDADYVVYCRSGNRSAVAAGRCGPSAWTSSTVEQWTT